MHDIECVSALLSHSRDIGRNWNSLRSPSRIENKIDYYNKSLKPLNSFILPGGSEASTLLHQSRTIARRAEREAKEEERRKAREEEQRRVIEKKSREE